MGSRIRRPRVWLCWTSHRFTAPLPRPRPRCEPSSRTKMVSRDLLPRPNNLSYRAPRCPLRRLRLTAPLSGYTAGFSAGIPPGVNMTESDPTAAALAAYCAPEPVDARRTQKQNAAGRRLSTPLERHRKQKFDIQESRSRLSVGG